MIRRLFLAVLFCLAASALVERTFADSADGLAADATATATATTASVAGMVGTPPIDTHPPEARWEALPLQSIGSGSSRSHHLQQLQAVDLPGISSRAPWPVVHRAHAARHSEQFRPPHLHHTPLLI